MERNISKQAKREKISWRGEKGKKEEWKGGC